MYVHIQTICGNVRAHISGATDYCTRYSTPIRLPCSNVAIYALHIFACSLASFASSMRSNFNIHFPPNICKHTHTHMRTHTHTYTHTHTHTHTSSGVGSSGPSSPRVQLTTVMKQRHKSQKKITKSSRLLAVSHVLGNHP